MANRFEKMKMEVSTRSQGCLTRETGESGPRLLKCPPFRKRYPMPLAISSGYYFEKLSTRSSFLIYVISFGHDSKKRPHFRMKHRYIAGNLLLNFFSESGSTVNFSNHALGEKNGSRYLSEKDRKYSDRSEPNSVRLGV